MMTLTMLIRLRELLLYKFPMINDPYLTVFETNPLLFEDEELFFLVVEKILLNNAITWRSQFFYYNNFCLLMYFDFVTFNCSYRFFYSLIGFYTREC